VVIETRLLFRDLSEVSRLSLTNTQQKIASRGIDPQIGVSKRTELLERDRASTFPPHSATLNLSVGTSFEIFAFLQHGYSHYVSINVEF
jgi:hypothetical protein